MNSNMQAGVAGLLAMAASAASSAQAAWADKPIRVIVPFSAGGPPDIVLRAVHEDVVKELRQPIVDRRREPRGRGRQYRCVAKRIEELGTQPIGNLPAQADAAYRIAFRLITRLVKNTGVTPE